MKYASRNKERADDITDEARFKSGDAPQRLAARKITGARRRTSCRPSFSNPCAAQRSLEERFRGRRGRHGVTEQIGRASCRERVKITGLAVAVKKKTTAKR